ncbi:helix-turn-helix domain-containing protein [Bernardetia sp. Wsw4-3y2]|uniref:helix-turn-helix domain-containing protein n=1 Tax=Bernardetia sp. Wsw4-3y2 TaxID=3127471 RepID=UPI0030CB41C7
MIFTPLETHLKIAYLRKEKKLSQTEIAEILGISQNAYSRIERGETKLTIDRIKEIATILKVPYTELITNDKNEFTAMYQDISEQHEREKEVIENQLKDKNKYIKELEKTILDKEMIISLLQEKIKNLEKANSQNQ